MKGNKHCSGIIILERADEEHLAVNTFFHTRTRHLHCTCRDDDIIPDISNRQANKPCSLMKISH